MITGISAQHVWYQTLQELLKQEPRSSRIGPAREIQGFSCRIEDPCFGFINSTRRAVTPLYGAGELLWYLSGRQDLAMIKAYAPSYGRWSDDGINLYGAYGPKINIYKIIEMLKQAPDSRRVVIPIYTELGYESKNVPCTLSWQFLTEDNRLNMISTMRSSDSWLGFPYDTWVACLIQQLVADDLGLELGWYQHNAGSQHLYEKHVQRASEVENEAGWRLDFDKPVYSLGMEIVCALKAEEQLRAGRTWTEVRPLLIKRKMLRRPLGLVVWLCALQFAYNPDTSLCPWPEFYERAIHYAHC